MFRATPRVRLSVIAASVLICLGFASTPAFASITGPMKTASTSSEWQKAANTLNTHHVGSSTLTKHEQSVRRVLREAQRQRGKPYVYGEAGPHGFDCSGLVRFVFLHAVHRSLPHNAAAQYHALRHIRRHSLQPGDLVFVDNGGYISHVGIYDGHDHWWVAPHTGTHVQRQHIYRAHLLYARVLVYNKR